MTDVEYAMMSENIATFKKRIVEFLRSGETWPCPRCGESMRLPEDGWWSASDLREATHSDGPSGMVAINELVAAGELEQNPRLQVRLANG
jgi:hypothetical protein